MHGAESRCTERSLLLEQTLGAQSGASVHGAETVTLWFLLLYRLPSPCRWGLYKALQNNSPGNRWGKKMNSVSPAPHPGLLSSRAPVTSSCLPLFPRCYFCEVDSLQTYLCKILTPFRHRCFLTESGLLQHLNTCIYSYSSPSCWNLSSRGSWKMCILCSVTLITLFVELESRILFLFFECLFTCGASQCYGMVDFLYGKDQGLMMLALNSSCDPMVCAAASLCAGCLSAMTVGPVTLLFDDPVYFRAHYNL